MLLPGDPGRALRLAQALTSEPKMLNHNRGLWGYTGVAADGGPLTIQSTGMGGPSAAIVLEELIALGARRLVRVGTCGGLQAGLELGELIAPDRVLPLDGTSRAITGSTDPLVPDAKLLERLDGRRGPVATVDLFYDDSPEYPAEAVAVEMEAATVLAVARRRGVAAAVLLVVSDLLAGGERKRIGDDELLAAELRLGDSAWGALR